MEFEEARELLDNVIIDYAPSAASLLEILEEQWDEYSDAIQALIEGWAEEL